MRWGAALAVIAALAAGAWAQSLEDLAQKEKARRKRTAGAKTFTNDDLSKAAPSPSPTPETQEVPGKPGRRPYRAPAAAAPEGGSPQGSTGGRAVEGEGNDTAPSVDQAGAQASWRGRAQALRDTIAKSQQTIATLQTRADQLRLDRDPNPPDQLDPNRLQKRAAELQRTLDEIEKVRSAVTETQQQQQALEDEARSKSIPLSWVQ